MKLLFRVALAVFSFLLTLLLVYEVIIPRYFFDLLIYRKNNRYGYAFSQSQSDISEHEKRTKDVYYLQWLLSNDVQVDANEIEEEELKIAVIGDSYAWGQGVKYEKRFSNVLKNKLIKMDVRARVFNLAQPGDSILDYLAYYETFKSKFGEPDMYIFLLVSNDYLPRKNGDSLSTTNFNGIDYIKKCESQHDEPMLFDLSNADWVSLGEKEIKLYFDNVYGKILKNPTNLCLYETIIPMLPTKNALYMVTDYFDGNYAWPTYLEFLKKNEKKIIDVISEDSNGTRNVDFKKYTVSALETHPSVYAHNSYADLAIKEMKKTGLIH